MDSADIEKVVSVLGRVVEQLDTLQRHWTTLPEPKAWRGLTQVVAKRRLGDLGESLASCLADARVTHAEARRDLAEARGAGAHAGGCWVSELTIVQPGGVAVATEEVFVLIDAMNQMRRDVDFIESALAHPGSSYRPHGYHRVSTGVRLVGEDLVWLSQQLTDYTEQVAWQEAWRSRLWEGTRDRWWGVMVALGTGFPQRQGLRPDATLDDAAAMLLGGEGDYAPVVEVRAVESSAGQSVSRGVAERIARIPHGDNPIRIERYPVADGSWHTEVFVAGTRTWSLDHSTDPFDMRSNMALVAGIPAAATIATERAMRRAGVRHGEPVVFVGHSQGGAVAQTLAESGRYRTRGLVTVGAPLGNHPVTGDYPALRIEHRDDLVVELGGRTHAGQQLTIESDSGAVPGDVAEAHSRTRYGHTAERIDQSKLPELADWDRDLPQSLRGRMTLFDAVLTSDRGGAAGGKTTQ